MKNHFRSFVPLLALAGALLNSFSVTAADSSTLNAEIPNRPEKLKFPPLQYDPPNPRDYRVELKSGPIAYVVPDRELPLVNIVVYVRTGEYLVCQPVVIVQENANLVRVALGKLSKGYLVPRVASTKDDELHVVLHERRYGPA